MPVSKKRPIVIVGASYVGLITGVGFAQAREVRLVDKKADLIADLETGRMPIYEPELEQRFERNRERLRFYTRLEDALEDGEARLVFVAVGTPRRAARTAAPNGVDSDAASLDAVHGVLDVLLGHRGIAAVMKSTVPPGTGRKILRRAEECDSDLTYLSCPEFLQEGGAFENFDHPDRIVVGCDELSWASEELRELHEEIHPGLDRESGSPRYLEVKLTNAELVKHASNLHLATRISYANQIGNLCEELGGDVSEVMEGVGADSRIGSQFLRSGMGFGGSCFDKDVRALRAIAKKEADIDLSFVDTVLAVNAGQVERTVGKLKRRLGTLKGSQVAILGLAFKPETDDLRGSPALALASELRRDDAIVRAWDPSSGARARATGKPDPEGGLEPMATEEIADSASDAMEDADAVVLATEWSEFAEIDWAEAAEAMRGTLVIDGRNHLVPEDVRAAGLEYEGTGRESRGLLRPLPETTIGT
jgi:UDPglucose 6-dehydrogenase